jgi:hypothetical protein
LKTPSNERQAAGYSHRLGGHYRPPPLRDYDADARHLQKALIDRREQRSWRANLAYVLVTIAAVAATFYPWSN